MQMRDLKKDCYQLYSFITFDIEHHLSKYKYTIVTEALHKQAGSILLKIKRSRVFRIYKTSVTKIIMMEKINIPETKNIIVNMLIIK